MELARATFITCSAPNLQEEFSSCSIIQSEPAIWKYTSIKPDHNQITRKAVPTWTYNTSSSIAIVISVYDQELLNSSHWLHVHLTTQFMYGLQKAKYRDVREHQRKVTESHCCGKDVFLSAPTGWSGKKAWPLRWPHSFSIFYVTAKEKRLCPFAWFRLNGHQHQEAIDRYFVAYTDRMTSLDSISSKGNKSSSRSLALRARSLELWRSRFALSKLDL